MSICTISSNILFDNLVWLRLSKSSVDLIYRDRLVGFGKGVTDLETCMDYFTIPEGSCENLNFPVHLS